MKGRGKGRQVTGDEWRLHTRGRTMKRRGKGRQVTGDEWRLHTRGKPIKQLVERRRTSGEQKDVFQRKMRAGKQRTKARGLGNDKVCKTND